MRWFDSDYDYVQELKEAWERGKKKIRNAYLILAAVLLRQEFCWQSFPQAFLPSSNISQP